uniref:EF-hand and coiled-coil domain-containing protein 1-like n=1 Tax=Monopterus albus TaxID=43700 RepID=UPI0009B3B286|nr:EF-hand and coiled-coil domain-containing protein 1-like [Monopterus albus]
MVHECGPYFIRNLLLSSAFSPSFCFASLLFHHTALLLFFFLIKDSLVQELQQKAEETELHQMELQMLETERAHLSLVEEKLVDILQLLQQLRDLNISQRSLGKVLLLSTLESCSDPKHGKAHILEVLNALYHELAACEILSTGGPLERTQSQQSLNALIISC